MLTEKEIKAKFTEAVESFIPNGNQASYFMRTVDDFTHGFVINIIAHLTDYKVELSYTLRAKNENMFPLVLSVDTYCRTEEALTQKCAIDTLIFDYMAIYFQVPVSFSKSNN